MTKRMHYTLLTMLCVVRSVYGGMRVHVLLLMSKNFGVFLKKIKWDEHSSATVIIMV